MYVTKSKSIIGVCTTCTLPFPPHPHLSPLVGRQRQRRNRAASARVTQTHSLAEWSTTLHAVGNCQCQRLAVLWQTYAVGSARYTHTHTREHEIRERHNEINAFRALFILVGASVPRFVCAIQMCNRHFHAEFRCLG